MTRVSQSGIEEIIERYFGGKRDGFFVEVGAWDGEHISQTAWLERERGWRGVCADPFPRGFESRACVVANHAVSAKGGTRKFIKVSIDRRHGGDVSYLSGFKDSLSAHWHVISEFCNYEEMDIPTIPFDELCRLYSVPAHVDFLSLDTEGCEAEILESVDFMRYSFGMICVEHNLSETARQRIADVLLPQGYKLYKSIMLDDLYVSV